MLPDNINELVRNPKYRLTLGLLILLVIVPLIVFGITGDKVWAVAVNGLFVLLTLYFAYKLWTNSRRLGGYILLGWLFVALIFNLVYSLTGDTEYLIISAVLTFLGFALILAREIQENNKQGIQEKQEEEECKRRKNKAKSERAKETKSTMLSSRNPKPMD